METFAEVTEEIAARQWTLGITLFPWGPSIGEARRTTWEALVAALSSFHPWVEELSLGWSPSCRACDTVIPERDRPYAFSCLVLDVVDGTELEALADALDRYEYLAHALPGHQPDAPRFRLVLPLQWPVWASGWDRFWHAAAWRLTGGHADPTSRPAERFLRWPSDPDGVHRRVVRHRGRWLHPGEMAMGEEER